MVNEHKIAQMAAFFLAQNSGRMAYMQLVKLLYLAERTALKVYGVPMSGDQPFAVPNGPVLTLTLDLAQGKVQHGVWNTWVSTQVNHEVTLTHGVERSALDELSEADLEILQTVWKEFGHFSPWELVEYTHTQCPEWKDPHGSSQPIPYYDIFRAVGKSPEEATALSEEIASVDAIDRLFQSL